MNKNNNLTDELNLDLNIDLNLRQNKNTNSTETLNELMLMSDEEIKLYILNEKNKYITIDFIEGTLKKYGIDYKINDISIFQLAMTHTSYIDKDFKNDKNFKMTYVSCKENNLRPIDNPIYAIPLQKQSYERLEFLGDSVIHLALADYLYNRYQDEYEGFMTRLRTKIENGKTLAQLSKILQLNEYMLISRNIEENNGRDNNEHILEDCLEAFVGALYLDSRKNMNNILIDLIKKKYNNHSDKKKYCTIIDGIAEDPNFKKIIDNNVNNFDICARFVISIIEKEIDIASLLYHESNHKDSLLQYHHKMKWSDPQYSMLELVGPDYHKIFKMCIKDINGKIIGTGIGNSKKKGEQDAAKGALIYYGVIKNEDSDDDDGDEIIISDTDVQDYKKNNDDEEIIYISDSE
jgi:dsRNA-specific ribonuclease